MYQVYMEHRVNIGTKPLHNNTLGQSPLSRPGMSGTLLPDANVLRILEQIGAPVVQCHYSNP